MVNESDPRFPTYDDGDAAIDLSIAEGFFNRALEAEHMWDHERAEGYLRSAIEFEKLALNYRNIPV
jgi:hypothetical protein